MLTSLRFWTKLSILLVYLVILAGSIVRMTGSGMGCPDWPKCFGYLIPPTKRSQLEWKPNESYKKGQIIIKDDALYVANKDFITTSSYLDANWSVYTKHDYAEFNANKTYIEYINRLLGVLAGLATLGLLISSLFHVKLRTRYFLLSLLVVLGMGFQGWLGKVVVDSNLLPWKVSVHMVMALIIVFILVTIITLTKPNTLSITRSGNVWVNRLLIVGFILLLIQIGLGLQVRQIVDLQINQGKIMGAISLKDDTPSIYYLHAGLGFTMFLIHLILAYLYRKKGIIPITIRILLILISLEILLGLILFHFDFPFSSQPLHLVIASLLFGIYSLIIIDFLDSKIKIKESEDYVINKA